MHTPSLLRAVGALLAATVLLTHTAARGEDAAAFPSRPLRVLLGFPPGSSTDTPMRVLAENVSKLLKQPVIVENKPGAAGILPAQTVRSAAPDGYMLAVVPAGVFRSPYTSNVAWDPGAELSYVLRLSGYIFGIVVPATSPIKTLREYIDHAKAHPGELTYSTPGALTTNHVTMEQFSRAAGIKLNHVPFKGTAESLQALMGGHVQSAAETSGWVPYVESGKLRLLAVWTEKRLSRFPDAPTLKELGIDIVQTAPFGLAAPRGTDARIIRKLHDAFKQAMEMPNYVEALAKFEMQPMYLDSGQYSRFAADSLQREKEILQSLNLTKASR